jgi:pyruvate kinase
MQKLTKIVATIGPATEEEAVLIQLIEAGMNIARFNTKHSDPAWHNERIRRVKKVAQELGQPIGVLFDLQGPEVRVNLIGTDKFEVAKDATVIFTSEELEDNGNAIMIPQEVVKSMSLNDQILLDDGSCEFVVVEKGDTQLVARALHECTVKHRKTMNTPGVVLNMPSLTERDIEYLDGVDPALVDFVGLSFVRDAHDIEILRAELKKRNITAGIVSKIENQKALDNLDELIEASDAVMVARGDLGVEVAFQELTYWQKQIIKKCRIAGKPVITATQMLKSMVTDPRPTRAEVSDVANAIYDGTDAVMLSEETTIGKYPVRAVAAQASIAQFNEPYCTIQEIETAGNDAEESITPALMSLLNHSHLNIDKIVCLTRTGKTARLISRFRPKVPVLAITRDEAVLRGLAISYGVIPCLINITYEESLNTNILMSKLEESGTVKAGETILLAYSNEAKYPRHTNAISIISVPKAG